MIILLFLIRLFIEGLSSWSTDYDCRQNAINRGGSVYSSSTGLRDVETGKHCYINVSTDKKTLW
ncbi:hypothetical protein FMM68_07120 [Lachnospiraceae bacterium MD329]|nr:hypothetical protein [Lachnospiraceae bacterium MD329]